ncbi:acyl-CoA Delta(11) desaturase-like [Pseudomyrmex gracilis]|uniref:acyl-CoA Delta(11) desaturase-like n=1 Tax=Pseudomyrmex gracilis TaxID=219809 RepID=UPI000994C04C|nr:acyl-CoA Delta(11) desaturase-like [Pseudomyrmex gracilis]
MIFQTVAYQGTIYDWARDHRVHHKFSDTDADPYNIRRGFFFSHIGWLLIRKHPDVLKKGATISCSDLEKDPFVVFQRKYYLYLVFVLSFIVPTLVPWLVWNESLWYSGIASITRYCITIHLTASVNSLGHRWGMRPYDNSISPVENAVISVLVCGEGWHNYHHVFPWDYKTAEFGSYTMNITTAFIDFFAFVGWAYDRKTASTDIVKKHVLRNIKENIDNKSIKQIK